MVGFLRRELGGFCAERDDSLSVGCGWWPELEMRTYLLFIGSNSRLFESALFSLLEKFKILLGDCYLAALLTRIWPGRRKESNYFVFRVAG